MGCSIGILDNYSRSSMIGSGGAGNHTNNSCNSFREDSSGSEDGGGIGSGPYDSPAGVHFYLGGQPTTTPITPILPTPQPINHIGITTPTLPLIAPQSPPPQLPIIAQTALPLHTIAPTQYPLTDSVEDDNSRHSPSISSEYSERSLPVPPRTKKQRKSTQQQQQLQHENSPSNGIITTTNRVPMPPPRKSNQRSVGEKMYVL